MKREELEQRLKNVESLITESKYTVQTYKKERKQLKKQLESLPVLEVGRWYVSKFRQWNYLLHLVSIDDGIENCTVYGFVDDEYYSQSGVAMDNIIRPATDKEVETALIKEAKKRYKTPCKINYFDNGIGNLNGFALCFNGSELCATRSSRDIIFKQGKWATIIKNTVHLEKGDYTEVQLKDALIVLNK